MKDSIGFRKKKYFQGAIAVIAWIALWWIASEIIDEILILPSPGAVLEQLISLARSAGFWRAILFSTSRVLLGFVSGLGLGILLGAVAYRVSGVEIFLRPAVSVLKAAPVASYIILFLLLMPSSRLSGVISLTMAFPLVYVNMVEGLHSTDEKLLEMARVFDVPKKRQILYIYFSTVMPFLLSACSLALGMCWKSGIAAEIIGMPMGSIGEQFYQAKVFVDTKTVLAWTVTVIIISKVIEKAGLFLLKSLKSAVERA